VVTATDCLPGNADAAVELITGIKKARTPASGKKEKAPLVGKPQLQSAAAKSPKAGPKAVPKSEGKGGNRSARGDFLMRYAAL
jgi:hypothetical protein